jgi:hypothetical protein
MLTLILFFALVQTPPPAPPTVRIAWESFPLSRPSNPGRYKIWRAAKSGDFCTTPTDFALIGQVQQTFDAAGNPIPPAFVDAKPLPSACYQVSFTQTPSGTPAAVESERSDPLPVVLP